MKKHHPQNERIKRRYFSYLHEARRNSEDTVDAAAKSIARFESYTGHKDFKVFRVEQAVAFKRHLAEQPGERAGSRLTKSTVHATLAHLKRFIQWLAGQPGYKSRMSYSDAEYFNLTENEIRVATAKRDQVGPTLEQVRHVISLMPAATDMERRDRAVVAFSLLTGARDSATASMKLKHVNVAARYVEQDAREVRTKFRKTFTTYFFPVGDEVEQIVIDWVAYSRETLMRGNDDPLFPKTLVEAGESHNFAVTGLTREHWKSAGPIRAIFRTAFEAAGIRYFNPHSLRNTLVRLGQSLCKNAEEIKCWSQNLGHEKVLTTMTCYGEVSSSRQGEVIGELRSGINVANGVTDVNALARAIVMEMKGAGMPVEQL